MVSADRYHLGDYSRWALVARGILSIIWGIIALVVPQIALLVFIYVFAAYALIDGVIAVVWAIQERHISQHWAALLIEGLIGIVVGIVAFAWPAETAIVLLFLVAFWAVITGILEIITAFTARDGFGHEWLLGIAGLISIIFGLILLFNPLVGLLALLWVVGVYAIIFGALLIARAFQSRGSTHATA